MSPRRDEFEGLRPRAGDAERRMLATLELLRRALGGRPGEEGVRCGSEMCLGELGVGDRGSWVFAAAACSDRRFREFVRRFASLFVDWRGGGRCALSPESYAAGPWLCILAASSRDARVKAVAPWAVVMVD
jgi:hypothetical protein